MHDLDGYTPLHKAVLYSQEESLLMLIVCGADLSNTDGNGYTALHVSLYYKHTLKYLHYDVMYVHTSHVTLNTHMQISDGSLCWK